MLVTEVVEQQNLNLSVITGVFLWINDDNGKAVHFVYHIIPIPPLAHLGRATAYVSVGSGFESLTAVLLIIIKSPGFITWGFFLAINSSRTL